MSTEQIGCCPLHAIWRSTKDLQVSSISNICVHACVCVCGCATYDIQLITQFSSSGGHQKSELDHCRRQSWRISEECIKWRDATDAKPYRITHFCHMIVVAYVFFSCFSRFFLCITWSAKKLNHQIARTYYRNRRRTKSIQFHFISNLLADGLELLLNYDSL